jgi:hypothetical protein
MPASEGFDASIRRPGETGRLSKSVVMPGKIEEQEALHKRPLEMVSAKPQRVN